MQKQFVFINAAAKREFLELPMEIQIQFASDLNAVCQGIRPSSTFEHLSGSVGEGAIELKENGSPAYRSIYCAKFLDTVYILHSFTKTTNGVDRKAMATAKRRHQEMMDVVREEQKKAKKQGRAKPKSSKNKKSRWKKR